MRNLFDYLDEYRDIPLGRKRFNNIDALILARLSYIPFDGVLVGDGKSTIAQAAHDYFRLAGSFDRMNMLTDASLLAKLAGSRRFADMRLLYYINQLDYDEQKQFSALTVDMGEAYFVSYRGTDSTLVGWKEDFNMSFMTSVPAQLDAVFYLSTVAEKTEGAIYVGGHSKGGNLAVYASAFCGAQVQERLRVVYNFDGPGFDSGVLKQQGYKNMLGRLSTFIPQSSVIGLLLEHEEDYHVINSKQMGLWQHDVYSWEVVGDDFVYQQATTRGSRFIDKTLKGWVARLQPQQREQFINAIYDIFTATNARTLRELTDNWQANAVIIMKAYSGLDEPVKQLLRSTLLALIKAMGPGADPERQVEEM